MRARPRRLANRRRSCPPPWSRLRGEGARARSLSSTRTQTAKLWPKATQRLCARGRGGDADACAHTFTRKRLTALADRSPPVPDARASKRTHARTLIWCECLSGHVCRTLARMCVRLTRRHTLGGLPWINSGKNAASMKFCQTSPLLVRSVPSLVPGPAPQGHCTTCPARRWLTRQQF